MEIIKSYVSKEEYLEYISQLDLSSYTQSDDEEIREIEDLLELKRNTLKGQEYFVSKTVCQCGKTLSFIDFVRTAISESNHSIPFLAHALLSNKYGYQSPRTVKCSSCGELHANSFYKTPNYSCRER